MMDDFYFYMTVGGYPPLHSFFSTGEETHKFSAETETKEKEQNNV